MLCCYPEWGRSSLENLGDRKGDWGDFNPFVSQSFYFSENKLEKVRSVSSYRRALILSKLLDSAEGQKQNLQLQSAAVAAAAAWREIWGQSC